MPSPFLLDPTQLDFSAIVADKAEILKCNPQRHEFELLDRVILLDPARGLFAGYHDVRSDAWWARGHIPGRPLFPGVLMIESSAQLASYVWSASARTGGFLGFAAVDEVKYRGPVEPPARFVLIGNVIKMTPKRTVADLQGFVDSKLVFEARVTGIPF